MGESSIRSELEMLGLLSAEEMTHDNEGKIGVDF
jgi:hypothetical protein